MRKILNMIYKKKIVFVLLILIVVFPIGITFSRYVCDFIGNYILKTNNFYFNSDKLGSPSINYNVNNWGGTGDFNIQFELNNHKNNLLISDSDIEYSINVSCSGDVICTTSSTSGVIYKEEMTDSIIVVVSPQRIFDTNESIEVIISATTSSPYVKTLAAKYTITVGKKGISYHILDQVKQPYFELSVTNARDQYYVSEAFDGYTVGTVLTTDTYKSLSSDKKSKCYSSRITLSFDPNDVVIDTTSSLFNSASYTTTSVDGVTYVNSITFDVDAMSSNILRFYKKDVSRNYSFSGTGSSIILFEAL